MIAYIELIQLIQLMAKIHEITKTLVGQLDKRPVQ